MKSLFEKMGGTYRREGDYLLPNLSLPSDAEDYQIGKYGRLLMVMARAVIRAAHLSWALSIACRLRLPSIRSLSIAPGTGNVTFEVQHIGGPNAVISAVFFDETQGPALDEKGKNGENAVQETPRTENGWNLKLSDGIVFSILFVILPGLMVATSAVREERKTK